MNSFYWGYVYPDHLKPRFLNIILDKKNLKYLSCPFENSKLIFFSTDYYILPKIKAGQFTSSKCDVTRD